MSFDFVFTTKAEQDLRILDAVTKKRILKKLQALKDYEEIAHIAIGLAGELRGTQKIRVGHYRIICSVDKNLLTILRIRHRKNAYSK